MSCMLELTEVCWAEGNTETVWIKETLDKEDITAGYDVSSFKEFAEAFELAEDTEKVNEEECYVLSGKVSGDKLEGILDTSMAAMDNAGKCLMSLIWMMWNFRLSFISQNLQNYLSR